jgi:hypothetical protein
MSGWVAGIGAAGAIGSGLLNLSAQQQQGAQQGEQLKMAMQNYILQKQQMEKQYELATAGRRDARGNQTRYVPGVGWTTDVTSGTRDIIQGSDAVQRQSLIDLLTRNRGERDLAMNRRLEEGSAASPMLAAIKNGYGAPTKEGVVGSNKIAGVTGVSENADNAKSAYGTAALRSGTTTNPNNFSNIDKGATTGIRKSLADVDAGADPLFQAHMSSYMTGKLNPYNTLATRASNIENIPFQPESQSGNMDASMANAAAVGATRGTAGASEGLYRGMVPVLGAMNQRPVNYDTFIGGVTENLKNLLRGSGESSSKPSISRNSSTQSYF